MDEYQLLLSFKEEKEEEGRRKEWNQYMKRARARGSRSYVETFQHHHEE